MEVKVEFSNVFRRNYRSGKESFSIRAVLDQSSLINTNCYLMMFTHKDYLPAKIINQIQSKISGVEFDNEFRYDKGLVY